MSNRVKKGQIEIPLLFIYLGKVGGHKYSCKKKVFHSVVIALKRRRLRVEWWWKSSGLGVKAVSKAVIAT